MNISDSKALLTSAQVCLLQSCAAKPFMLGGFMSLNDIVTKLNVDILIEPGIPERSVDDYYEEAIEYWKKVHEKLREKMREDNSLWEEYRKAADKLERLYSERQAHSSMILLGLYDSKKNIIKLFPEAMAVADASKMDEYLVSTFAHEVMHAYFNRPSHERYPYAMFVEEPLAEYGMLLYMHETHSAYYDWAHNNVSGKKCCYGYGAVIMNQYLNGDYYFRKCLEEYKIAIDENEMLDVSNGRISMPGEGGFVNVNGQTLAVKWTPVSSVPPTYFWDSATQTLGLDGDWRGCEIGRGLMHHIFPWSAHPHFLFWDNVESLYLGKDYIGSVRIPLPIFVSPQHKDLISINGILVRKKDHTPDLPRIGDGYYELKKNGKYGIIDTKLHPITPFKYDRVWDFDKNGLCKVKIGNLYGLVNKQGGEQVSVIYEDISRKDLLYEVKLDGESFKIDAFGNKLV